MATPHGLAYTRRLCRHFEHRVPASFAGNHGQIQFEFGLCTIENEDEFMNIRIDVADADELDRAEQVVGKHLVRMANKDEPVVTWQRMPPGEN